MQYSKMSVMQIADRKVIIDSIIDNQFLPALMRKIMPFIAEVVEKKIQTYEFSREVGFKVALPNSKSTLDIRPELDELSRKMCILYEKTNDRTS
jgi:hypothetical protein